MCDDAVARANTPILNQAITTRTTSKTKNMISAMSSFDQLEPFSVFSPEFRPSFANSDTSSFASSLPKDELCALKILVSQNLAGRY